MKLNELSPRPGSAKKRMRVGRGPGSGKGKTAGRGVKGQKARTGVALAGFEGGQMPLYMRVGKQRGSTSKDAMPIVPFMTRTQPINLRDLEARFDDGAEVTPQTLAAAGLATRKGVPIKVLGDGDLSKKLTVRVHRFSRSARERIEAAGGTCEPPPDA